MKKNLMKKIGALTLTLVMVLAMSVVTLAAAPVYAPEDPATTLTSIDIKVNFTPEAGLSTPGYTFSYSIAAGTAKDAVQDGIPVLAGTGSPSITASAAFAAGDTQKTITVTLPTFAANAGGVYRYKITQAQISADGVAAGVLNDKGNGAIEVRYLDLYVNNAGEIKNAVLFKVDSQLPAVVNNEIAYGTDDGLKKTDSFENTFGKPGNDDPDPDDPTYPPDPNDPKPSDSGKHTVTVSKTLAGSFSSANEVFPFEITLTDISGTTVPLTGVDCEIAVSGTPVLTDSTIKTKDVEGTTVSYLDGTSATPYKVGLKGGDSITITVPNNINVKVQEKTAETEGYIVFNTDKTETWGTGWQKESDGKLVDETGVSGALTTAAHGNPVIPYTNSKDTISPTGVLLRVAPYMAILGGGFALLLVSKRSKKEEEEA